MAKLAAYLLQQTRAKVPSAKKLAVARRRMHLSAGRLGALTQLALLIVRLSLRHY